MRRVRVGLVGAGFAARFHRECLSRVYGVEVVLAGVTSRRAESRDAFGRQYGIPVYPNLAAMLPDVDLVDIVTPPYAHEEAIRAAIAAGKAVICEKPLTGYFGPPDADDSYRGDKDDKVRMLEAVLVQLRELRREVESRGVMFGYAENFVYAPSIQKEREIVEKTGAQVLRMLGEESHNGSTSPVYGIWRFSGGGSLMGKGCHPLSAALYLKRVEGLRRLGRPIRPKNVSSRTHQVTRSPAYQDAGFIRTEYHDIEDYGLIHLTFEDDTVADILTSELVLGGVYGYVEVFANNHRTRCKMSPVEMVETYNPRGEQYKDIYLIEKGSTKEGWSLVGPDENITQGYLAEMQDFVTCAATGGEPQSGLELAVDTIAVIYAAYLSDQRKGEEVAIPTV